MARFWWTFGLLLAAAALFLAFLVGWGLCWIEDHLSRKEITMTKIVLGVIAVVLLLAGMFNQFSRAGDRVELMEQGRVPLVLCKEAASAFDQGVWGRNLGIAHAIVQAPPGEAATVSSAADVPKEAFHHPDWDAMTDKERAFFSEHLFAGWTEADRIITTVEEQERAQAGNEAFSITVIIDPVGKAKMTQAYFEKCMQIETAKRTFKRTGFVRTGSVPPMSEEQASELIMGAASSQSLEGPPIGMEQACAHLKLDIKIIARALSRGEPIDELKGHADKARADLGEERFGEILKMIDEAYAHEGPLVDWMRKRYAACMGNPS